MYTNCIQIVYNLTELNIISGLYTNCIQFVYDHFCIQIVYSDCIQFVYNPENFFHVCIHENGGNGKAILRQCCYNYYNIQCYMGNVSIVTKANWCPSEKKLMLITVIYVAISRNLKKTEENRINCRKNSELRQRVIFSF